MNPIKSLTGVARVAAALSLLLACAASAQTLQNPSFENNTFTISPGTVAANGPITGWSVSDPAKAGLNPAGGSSTFANNGLVPSGSNVLWMQPTNVLSTTISDLTPGNAYLVRFRANSQNASKPTLRVAIDDVNLFDAGSVVSVGGSNPYLYVALPFTATAASQTLYITNDSSVGGVTNVLLLDDFSVAPGSATAFSVDPWQNDATSGIDGSRTYTAAYSFNNGSTTPVINGVTFTRIGGNSPAIPNEFVSVNLGSGTTDAGNELKTAGGGSGQLASQFNYNGNPAVFTLNNLIPGAQYVATIFSVGWDVRSYGRSVTFASGNDRFSVNQDLYGNDKGIRVSFRYTASPQGSITFSNVPFSTAVGTLHTYGLANYAVNPETTPVIGLQPVSKSTVPGGDAGFVATAGGARPLAYRWLKDGAEVAGQTNRTLSLTNVTASSLGGYTLWVSNSLGMATSAVASLTFSDAVIPNPSFETERFTYWPGYISGNYAISGWAFTPFNRAGINPLVDGQGPFANNGLIPDGTQAAFLQSTSSARTVISGLVPGQNYTLNFRGTARATYKPILRIAIDETNVIDTFWSNVGGTNRYRYVAVNFTAINTNAILGLTNDISGDHTVVIDNFSIAPSNSQWSVSMWTNDLSSGVDGTKFFTHAYHFGNSIEAVINGVPFRPLTTANPTVPNQLIMAGFPSVYTAGDSNVLTLEGAGSAGIAQAFIYGGALQSITLTNLQPGMEYVASIYTVGWEARNYGRSATFFVGNDRMTVNQDGFGPDIGVRVSYRYVADASGAITLNYEGTDSGSTIHTYAFANYQANDSAPIVGVQPQSAFVALGDTATLSIALSAASQPVYYQWYQGSTLLDGQTNTSLVLSNLTSFGTTSYYAIISNALGMATSTVASVQVGLRFSELYNTGVDNNGALLPGLSVDPHYKVTFSSDPATPGPVATVMPDNQYPVVPGTYFSNGPGSMWITVSTNAVAGTYVYHTTFILDTVDPNHSQITGRWASDNDGLDILLNGVSTGVSNRDTRPFSGFFPFVITNGFVAGSNTLDLVISNQPPTGYTAVRAELYGVGQPLPPTVPHIVSQPTDQTVQDLDDVTFAVVASGSGPLRYQWYYFGFDLANETNRTLHLTRVSKLDQEGEYTVKVFNSEGQVESAVANLSINLPPTANSDSVAAARDTALAIPASKLLFNDSDDDGDTLSVVAVSATSTNGGTVSLAGNVVTYTPVAGYTGPDEFTYTLGDSRNGRATGVVSVNVGATNFLSIVTPPALQSNGHFTVGFSGVPGYPYTIETATNILGPWQVLTNIVADVNGNIQVDDQNTPPAQNRFYRTKYP